MTEHEKQHSEQDSHPEQWMEEFILTDDDIAEMEDAEFIIPNLIISGHIVVIAAPPGKGKTTIAMHEATNMVKAGYRVMYVNMDCGAADMKHWHSIAKQGGFSMVTPHFQGADGIKKWKAGLASMTARDDLGGLVIVVDTLKKISDMLNKAHLRAAFSVLRTLTAKGCTIVLLSHTNKNRDMEGNLVFEGTGDVMADCDDMIYLDSDKDRLSRTQTVTTYPTDKVRGFFEPRSWEIHPDRTVKPLDHFEDIAAKVRAKDMQEKDTATIEVITQGIRAGKHLRIELQEYCKEQGVSKRPFDRVIKRYCMGSTPTEITPLWRNERQFRDNASYYILLDDN